MTFVWWFLFGVVIGAFGEFIVELARNGLELYRFRRDRLADDQRLCRERLRVPTTCKFCGEITNALVAHWVEECLAHPIHGATRRPR